VGELAGEAEQSHCLGHVSGERVWDPMDDGALIFRLGDSNAGHCEFVTPLLQGAKKLPEVTSFWALHIEERLVHVCLCVHSFRCGKDSESVPLLFDCQVAIHVHGYFVGEMLAKKALCDFVFTLPSLGFQVFCRGGIAWVLGNRGHCGALEVTPAASKFHGAMEAVGKCCPI